VTEWVASPGITLHEFETPVIAAALEDGEFLGGQEAAERLRAVAGGSMTTSN
jgi:hypothetical protein